MTRAIGICGRCAEPLVDAERGCEFCRGERREEAVKALVAAANNTSNQALAARAESVHTLRTLGYSSKQAVGARDEAREGRSVEEIVQGLAESETVAAA